MRIIDLLNKIANGEEVPIKFTYKGYLWEYDVKNKMWFYYFGEGKNHRFDRLFYLNNCLNDEVKIIEEPQEHKIPEKIPLNYVDDRKPEEVYEYLRCSYNQLIDYLKSKGE